NFVGRPVSGEEPLKSGPRHCGQFSARAGKSRKKKMVETRADGTAARDVLKNCVVKFKGAMVCPIANHSMEHKPISVKPTQPKPIWRSLSHRDDVVAQPPLRHTSVLRRLVESPRLPLRPCLRTL